MKKYSLILLILLAAIAPFFIFKKTPSPSPRGKEASLAVNLKARENNLLMCLKQRKDKLALIEAGKILINEPDNLCALWAKAEIFRRSYKFQEAQGLLDEILSKNPDYTPALISLSYIKYRNCDFNGALKLLNPLLNKPALEKENLSLVYMLLGSINAKRASSGGLLSKIIYATHIKGFFEKAKSLGPDLAEVRLGLGTFYLVAPKIIGGNIGFAIQELKSAIELAPDFATPHARLAQAYKKKGDLENYNFYLQRAKELDPENEVVKEIE
jgi:tetratricopeptide (TPR) repeat protein